MHGDIQASGQKNGPRKLDNSLRGAASRRCGKEGFRQLGDVSSDHGEAAVVEFEEIRALTGFGAATVLWSGSKAA